MHTVVHSSLPCPKVFTIIQFFFTDVLAPPFADVLS